MTLYLDDGDVRLYHGDALDVLRQLPDGCVDMVATSPPFYGLRDYGTGEWEGGQCGCGMKFRDVRGVWMCLRCQKPRDCNHKPLARKPGSSTLAAKSHGGYSESAESASRSRSQMFPETCGKCGARRVDRQIGLEESPDEWVARLVAVFRECRRVLADHGTLWVEIGDRYCANQGRDLPKGGDRPLAWSGHQTTPMKHPSKPKDLLGQPWMLAFALRADGWYLRSEIIWARPNPMPESVTDRPTKAHSTVFLLSKQPRYFYDADAIREPNTAGTIGRYGKDQTRSGASFPPETIPPGHPTEKYPQHHHNGLKSDVSLAGANARSVWTLPTEPTPFAHFATWPQALVRRMILAGSREGGMILDPFSGSGTTLLVARNHGRHAIGIELNESYCKLAAERLSQLSLLSEAHP